MKNNHCPFLFSDEVSQDLAPHDYLMVVPAGIASKSDLLSNYAATGRFPAYFGENWDALLDCLRDFSWIVQKRISIWHLDLPLSENALDLETYIGVLATAEKAWHTERLDKPSAHLQNKIPEFVPHELVITFPSASEDKVCEIIERIGR